MMEQSKIDNTAAVQTLNKQLADMIHETKALLDSGSVACRYIEYNERPKKEGVNYATK